MGPEDDLPEVAVDRRDALAALSGRTLRRRDLQSELDVSKTTCHRILRTFEDRGLVRRTDSGYRLTLLGRVVAEQVDRFATNVETARRMEPLLEEFDDSERALDEAVFSGADVEWTVERDRSLIDRGVDLVEETDLLRVLDWTPVPDLYQREILRTLADNGARVEAIYPESEVRDRLERFPDLHDELVEEGARPRYWVYDDVPQWGMSVYDDRLVELRAYEPRSGAQVLDATSDAPEAVDWALDVFAEYRDRAAPLTAVEGLPDWGDYSW